MGVDLRMEPYAKMCQNGLPESRIFDELGPESLLILLDLYRRLYEHPEHVAVQMQGISQGRRPGMEGRIGSLSYKRPWLVLR